ncbi:unnamed protein product [Adineta steineri]|uniref:Uncharacterized protein n=1 Tax=Adineta steineri TaxID=433720 RepID=A0A818VTB2_9BILA|nr:unnamed protein product [Adineta steineri]CAF0871646.1 unnamed protein product [Adineta steineri]CAF0925538.1 unnamed protein product [Adineta steineri]CAF3715569.1 unnamed protein product [Adineta steineri]CAF3861421.1 unnamed protein product [Adineta steineri]
MIKTVNLTRTLFNHHSQSQTINISTITTTSSGSESETCSTSSETSCKSNVNTIGLNINDDTNTIPNDDSTIVLLNLVDKLKRELSTIKQAKNQLETLYKAKSKSDLDKSAKITKLHLQYEHELSIFCKEDQKDLVCYLQRQLLERDQRIGELTYDIEQLKTWSVGNTLNDVWTSGNKKIAPVQVLRSSHPDLVMSTVSQKNAFYFYARAHSLLHAPLHVSVTLVRPLSTIDSYMNH